ncbi:hypothetical protein JTE90_024861 [Oedothorax gibbosus]|uniref:Autophagy-related protein n=1 Tax=Oedothorax gibbosus TaxID=931172 RepID=A0AAV6V3W8_9ARAC|nr:hypothetical protein JTE90_024861 [Oedothorax gibbosus]
MILLHIHLQLTDERSEKNISYFFTDISLFTNIGIFSFRNLTKLSYVTCYNSARRGNLADSNYFLDERSYSFSPSDRKESLLSELTCSTQAKTEWKYKKRKTFDCRKLESEEIGSLYPSSVPVILEKASSNGTPTAQKEKYLVPRNITVADFVLMVRKNMFLHNDASLLLVAGKEILHSSFKMGEVFDECKDEDGFLYLAYNAYKSFNYSKDSYGRML